MSRNKPKTRSNAKIFKNPEIHEFRGEIVPTGRCRENFENGAIRATIRQCGKAKENILERKHYNTLEKHLLRGEVFSKKSSSHRLPCNSALLQGTSISFSGATLQSPRTSQELTKSDNLVRFLPDGDNQSSLGSPLLVPRSPEAKRRVHFL